ncbi:hypothetical protein SMICM17S_01411 [Streptomyces microflavus]
MAEDVREATEPDPARAAPPGEREQVSSGVLVSIGALLLGMLLAALDQTIGGRQGATVMATPTAIASRNALVRPSRSVLQGEEQAEVHREFDEDQQSGEAQPGQPGHGRGLGEALPGRARRRAAGAAAAAGPESSSQSDVVPLGIRRVRVVVPAARGGVVGAAGADAGRHPGQDPVAAVLAGGEPGRHPVEPRLPRSAAAPPPAGGPAPAVPGPCVAPSARTGPPRRAVAVASPCPASPCPASPCPV